MGTNAWLNRLQTISIAAAILLTISVDPVRSIKLFRSRSHTLSILDRKEERLYFNMEKCDQSSNIVNCKLAIDNSYSQEPTQCSTTKLEERPYWRAILDTPAYISTVTILSSEREYKTGFKDALVRLSLLVNNDICISSSTSDITFTKQLFPCDSVGDQLTILSEVDQKSVLVVCDVEVIGVPLKFASLLGNDKELSPEECTQSSESGTEFCNKAFDNKTDTCSLTKEEEKPWLEVTLEKPAILNGIRITSSGLKNFRVTLDGRLCDAYSGPDAIDSKTIIKCKYFGLKLRISSEIKMALSVCEIQLYGHEAVLPEVRMFKPMGCYKDTLNDPALPNLVSSTRMSHEKCYQLCKNRHHVYFAVQRGYLCLCGGSIEKFTEAESAEKCDVSCSGKEGIRCGGKFSNSGVAYSNVFQIL